MTTAAHQASARAVCKSTGLYHRWVQDGHHLVCVDCRASIPIPLRPE